MSKLNSLYVSLLALVVAFVALGMCIHCCSKAPGGSVEETLNNNPQMIINAMQKYEQQMRDQAAAEAQKVIQANIEDLNNNPNTPFVGNADAKVTLVEFFDYSCGYCHKLYPGLKQVIANNPDVKVVFKALAFVSPVSQYAAKATLAANEQGKFIELHNALFEAEGRLTEAKVDEIAVKTGLDLEKLKADMNSAKVEGIMKDTNDLAGKIQVNGVPALVLNGKMLQTIDGDVIQNEINNVK